ncbi:MULTISPECIES: VENN motif pre-toxin domain-containing protein [Burkholderia]|uniref:VENN motif pre-toxin domain-containing protein n=1 Tax=Burkholderia TaxID=32008 RepID=UPI000A87F080|nr:MULTISPECIES: VENN motif pre-toxin domain-containing protein [Burkholderia]
MPETVDRPESQAGQGFPVRCKVHHDMFGAEAVPGSARWFVRRHARAQFGPNGASGGATSAVLSPAVIDAIDPSGAPLNQGQIAAIIALATLAGGGLARLAGRNAMAGTTAAQSEARNNAMQHVGPKNDMLLKVKHFLDRQIELKRGFGACQEFRV